MAFSYDQLRLARASATGSANIAMAVSAAMSLGVMLVMVPSFGRGWLTLGRIDGGAQWLVIVGSMPV